MLPLLEWIETPKSVPNFYLINNVVHQHRRIVNIGTSANGRIFILSFNRALFQGHPDNQENICINAVLNCFHEAMAIFLKSRYEAFDKAHKTEQLYKPLRPE